MAKRKSTKVENVAVVEAPVVEAPVIVSEPVGNPVIAEINRLLDDAADRQIELKPEIEKLETIRKSTYATYTAAQKAKKAAEDLMEEPRQKAKELAAKFVQDGGNALELPKEITITPTVEWQYEQAAMVKFLVEKNLLHFLNIDNKNLVAMLEAGAPDLAQSPATKVGGSMAKCDTDLTSRKS